MKVSCTQENLQKGLAIVSHMVQPRATLPVLNNILLKTEKGRLKLSATDLEIGISTWIGAKVEKEGAFTCPGRLIAEYTNTNSDKTIKLELKDQTLNLTSDHFKANIKGIEASEFPLIPELNKGISLEISANDLREAITKTIIACAVDETRPVLAGVYIKSENKKIKFVATDSYRLAEKSINLAGPGQIKEKGFSFIIPQRTMAEINRLLDETLEKAEIKIGENQVQFKLGPTEVVSRLIEGSFPDYEQIIPSSTKTQVTLSKNQFANALKMASFFARESANNVKISFKKPDNVQITAVSPQIGDNLSQMSGEISGEELEIAFNAKFILDALGVIENEEVSIELSGSLAPGVIRPAKDKNYLYVIMPLRTEE